MSEKKNFETEHPRPRLIIRLTKKQKDGQKVVPILTNADKLEGSARATYLPEDEYLSPGKPKAYFYDLGTRLRTVTDINPDTEDTPALRSRLRLRTAIDVPTDATEDEPLLDHTLEYVEVAIDGLGEDLTQIDSTHEANGANLGVNADIALERQREFDKAYLGSRWRNPEDPEELPDDPLDPLGFTRAVGSLRRIPNCAPLPFNTQSSEGDGGYWDSKIELDMTLHKEDDEEEPDRLIAAPHERPITDELGYDNKPLVLNDRWKERDPKPEKDELERWNPVNVGDDMTGLNQGYMDTKSLGGGYDLKIDSRMTYEPFDTGNTIDFKVTRTPYYEGDEVEFNYSASKEGHIYLKPRYLMANPGWSWSRRQTYRAHTNYFSENTPIGGVFRPYAHYHITLVSSNFVTLFIQQLEYDAPDLPVAGTAVNVVQTTLTTGTLNGVVVTDGVAVDNAVQGFRITVSFIQHGPEGDPTIDGTWEGEVEAQLDYVTHDLVLGMTMRAGPFAFRIPLYSRPKTASWSSVFDYMSNDPAYEDFEGRIFSFTYGFVLSDDQKQAMFKRVSGWDDQKFNVVVSHTKWQHEDLPLCEGTIATPLEVTDFDDDTPYIAWHEAEKAEVEGCAATYPFTDPAGIEPVGDDWIETTDIAFLNAFPAKTLPEGALVGIVNQREPYYIWRKTQEDRELADYDRANLQGSVS